MGTQDLAFALLVHKQRIEVGEFRDTGNGRVEVSIHFFPAGTVKSEDVDFLIHPKITWKSWRSYFRSSPPQPLHVVAQTFREKCLMVGDDLSDFYRGAVTTAALENKWHVTVHSPDCDAHPQAMVTHRFRCKTVKPEQLMDHPISHSPFYHLFAKEKLDCCIGHGAWGGLFERRVRGRHDLSALFQDGMLEISGKRTWKAKFAKGATPGGSWKPDEKRRAKVAKVLEQAVNETKENGLAIADDTDCLRWVLDLSWDRLRAGGFFAFEQDGCYGGYTSQQKFAAPDTSATGWARYVSRRLAMGEMADGAQAIFMHKNLIVAQRQNRDVQGIASGGARHHAEL